MLLNVKNEVEVAYKRHYARNFCGDTEEKQSKQRRTVQSGYSNLRSRVLNMSADRSTTMFGLICCLTDSKQRKLK